MFTAVNILELAPDRDLFTAVNISGDAGYSRRKVIASFRPPATK